jgi:hypothetical protein
MAGLDFEVRAYRHGTPRVALWTLGHVLAFGLTLGAFAGVLTTLVLF